MVGVAGMATLGRFVDVPAMVHLPKLDDEGPFRGRAVTKRACSGRSHELLGGCGDRAAALCRAANVSTAICDVQESKNQCFKFLF